MTNIPISKSHANLPKLALIYPPVITKCQAIRDLGLSPPLHLLALASALRNKTDIKIFDGAHDNLETIASDLDEFKPDVIGINVDITNYDNAIKIANSTDARVILGGNYAAFLAEQILNNQKRVEAICFNDGEEALGGFVKGNLSAPNLIHRNGKNKFVTPDITKHLSPAYDLVDMQRYFNKQQEVFGDGFKMMQFYGQKGCVNHPHCAFCGRYEDGMRLRDPKIYCKEIKDNVKKHNLTEVWDRSDSFLQNQNWFSTVYNELKGLDVTFKTYARADQLSDENIKMMKDLGFRMVYIGYEAGDNEILRKINKHETTEQYLDATKRIFDSGIDIDGSFIIGLPGENKKTLENQVNFIEKLGGLGLRKIKVNRVLVLPGTPLYNQVCNLYSDVKKLDSLDISDMQQKLYSTYDLSEFGSVEKFSDEINKTANIMTDIILNKGGCVEGYGYNNNKKILGGRQI